ATADYSIDDLRSMVDAIPNPGRDYELFIAIGMALHSATNGGGDGYDIWLSWAERSPLHNESAAHKKWASFGKSASEITVGTLIHLARENGWQPPVTFTDNTDWGEIPEVEKKHTTTSKHNLLSPPGLVGDITRWINSR